MSRTQIALWIAPFWVPLLVLPFAQLVMFPYQGQGHWVVLAVFVSAVFSYGSALLFGVPFYRFLRTHRKVSLPIAIVLGFVIGVVAFAVFLLLLGIVLYGFVPADPSPLFEYVTVFAGLIWFGVIGSIGSLVGATWWLIARPHFPADAP